MLKKVLVLTSHPILPEQNQELKSRFKIGEIKFLPENLQQIWSNVLYDDKYYSNLDKIKNYMIETLKKEDYVIIQGNWGYVYKLVEEAKNNKIIPLYAFSIRDSSEEIINGEVVKIVKFKHQCFVEY